jgi:Fe-S-cluster containining protein
MITDLDTIKHLGERNINVNYRFRSFLKSKDEDRLDKTVNDLFNLYSSKIDCTKCGNCCTVLKPIIQNADIKTLATLTNKTAQDFKLDYVDTDKDGDMHFKDLPCPFLLDKKCTVYDSRPEDCRSYPHLHKEDFLSRLFGVIDNYSVCPIVFNVYEDLKHKFHFR